MLKKIYQYFKYRKYPKEIQNFFIKYGGKGEHIYFTSKDTQEQIEFLSEYIQYLQSFAILNDAKISIFNEKFHSPTLSFTTNPKGQSEKIFYNLFFNEEGTPIFTCHHGESSGCGRLDTLWEVNLPFKKRG